jgi:hypothetical protein
MSISRKLLMVVALAALAASLLVLPGSPAAAAPLRTPGAAQTTGKGAMAPASNATALDEGCSGWVDSGFHWSQNACIWWDSSVGIQGNTIVYFQTGFNRDHVTKCTVYATLVSSYRTTKTVSADCYNAAHQGGSWVFPGSDPWKFGFGRNSGDWYRLHACMIVWTGVEYNSCNGPHPISPRMYKP